MDERAAMIEPLIPGLRRYARAWLGDASLADDLVQDCLERAVASWRRRHGDAVRPWLYAILHNLLVDYSRRTARRGTPVPIDAADGPALSIAPEQAAGIEYSDLMRSLDIPYLLINVPQSCSCRSRTSPMPMRLPFWAWRSAR